MTARGARRGRACPPPASRRRAARPRGRRPARWPRAASRSGPGSAPVARRRRSGSARPRARAGAPARPAPGRSARRAAASPPRRGSSPARRSPRRAGRRRRAPAGGGRSPRPARREGCAAAARVAMRGASGATGWSLMCSSTRSDARQRASEVDSCLEAEAAQRARQRLAGGAVEDERDRVHGAGDQVDAGAGGLDRGGERAAARALAVEADRKAARLAGSPRPARGHGAARASRTGRGSGCARRRAPAGARPGRRARRFRRRARAVDEAGVELALGGGDRLARLAQIRDVVQRVVQAKDVDAALGRGSDEAADEVAADRPGADEEAAAQRERERRLRPRPERADPLPRALDPALDAPTRSSRRPIPRGRRSPPRRGSRRGRAARTSARRPASGSCPSSRIVVSTSAGTDGSPTAARRAWRTRPARRARCSASRAGRP